MYFLTRSIYSHSSAISVTIFSYKGYKGLCTFLTIHVTIKILFLEVSPTGFQGYSITSTAAFKGSLKPKRKYLKRFVCAEAVHCESMKDA